VLAAHVSADTRKTHYFKPEDFKPENCKPKAQG
jgi:hypothetical protein